MSGANWTNSSRAPADRDPKGRIEDALMQAMEHLTRGAPPKLAQAMEHAVFTPASRRRPLLCMAVATALGEDRPALTDAACASIELMHCASLVHDDLPCFDDAPMRRGVHTVHRAFGENLAVLAGDALILGAIQNVVRVCDIEASRAASLAGILSRAAGSPAGLVAGQAWESEPTVKLQQYHRAKTASLFEAATMAGAVAAGHPPTPWRELGTHLGIAYQIADDINDAVGDARKLGKPVGQDAALDRPNAVRSLGMHDALAEYSRHRHAALQDIPQCQGRSTLRDAVRKAFDALSQTWISRGGLEKAR